GDQAQAPVPQAFEAIGAPALEPARIEEAAALRLAADHVEQRLQAGGVAGAILPEVRGEAPVGAAAGEDLEAVAGQHPVQAPAAVRATDRAAIHPAPLHAVVV